MEDTYSECDLKLTISPPNLSRHESQPSGKKLRLSREQSILLEENFKEHSTLSPKHKWALAKKLNLEPRQIEIWFQNRRARQGIHDWLKRMTKLKRMEIEYEELKECFQRLREENAKLVREVHELKTMRSLQNPLNNSTAASAATLSICPSCQLLVPARISSSAFHY